MAVLQHPSRKLTVPDIAVVVLLLLAALLSAYFTLSRGAGTTCTVTYGSASETFPLSEDRTIPVLSNGHALTVVIEDGAVSVAASDCPDQVCVNSGSVSKAGQAVVCVPAQVTVRIGGSPASDADAVAGGVP